ncbi:NUDIX domain-containing protein [Patescibacteria group bacterium]
MEKVDILLPPTFKKSGQTKTLKQAWNDEEWLGSFNLWIIRSKPISGIVYQQRSLNSSWAPGKLDVSAAGHYSAGEKMTDGLREVKEELGKNYQSRDLTYLGRKVHLDFDIHGKLRKSVIQVFMIIDNSPLDAYVLEEREVYAICFCPLKKLIRAYTQKGYQFNVSALTCQGRKTKVKVTKKSFPQGWDDYHFKIALLAKRFLKGEKHLIY